MGKRETQVYREPIENVQIYPNLKEVSKFHPRREKMTGVNLHKGIKTFLQQVTIKYMACLHQSLDIVVILMQFLWNSKKSQEFYALINVNVV